MANPTTNYGFVMPSPTDLVTDLPADFDVFGQAVDTQMLTNANAAIAKTIVDAKGDLIGATAADTPARLAVGTNGQILTADSTAATGLAWATPAASGWSKITSTAFTTQSTVSFNNVFTSTYKNYRIVCNFTSSSAGSFYARLRASSSDNTASTYTSGWQYSQVSAGTSTAVVNLAANTYWYLHDMVSTGSVGHLVTLDVADPQTSSRTVYALASTWAGYRCAGGGYFDNSTVFDGITFYPSTGTITGTIAIYGYGA
jgi:hypothetical protein